MDQTFGLFKVWLTFQMEKFQIKEVEDDWMERQNFLIFT